MTTINDSAPKTIHRHAYQAPAYSITNIDLTFDLFEEYTQVNSVMQLERKSTTSMPLILDGENLELVSISINDMLLTKNDYTVDAETLNIHQPPEKFSLTIQTKIKPQENTELNGLYKSSGNFCTQCEAHGFRRITYYLDRPDVMASFTTTIIADRALYPVLLSNGNLIKHGSLEKNRHFATWHDPFNKPSYLFALVAGNLVCHEDTFITQSQREVTLKIFVQHGNEDKTQHAMWSLKEAMRWDEIAFGREYDLDIFMIVAVDDFNMGAMENKGLNIFNSKNILANPQTANDIDYTFILVVVGHEYFHNWTGNRITCRDWFQLSLKEGLTVYRDQEFTADMISRGAKRIYDAIKLRTFQFPQDDGPLAHNVRPDSYIEINNFYTTTIYEKGAEVIRMMERFLGKNGFRKGMDLYFTRHDGQAVTCDDFVKAMEDANQIDFTQFRLWYSQAGTPRLNITSSYEPDKQLYHLHITQFTPPTPGQEKKLPLHLPLIIGLLDKHGQEMPLQLVGTHTEATPSLTLHLREAKQTFSFQHITEQPIPSLLRGFSAPVKLHYDYTEDELLFLLSHDTDMFSRWEAGQELATKVIINLSQMYQAKQTLIMSENLLKGFSALLQNNTLDKNFLALALQLPSEITLADKITMIDVEAIYHARQFVIQQLAMRLLPLWQACYEQHYTTDSYEFSALAMGKRNVKNTSMFYLVHANNPQYWQFAKQQFIAANNMTDKVAIMGSITHVDCPERQEIFDLFYREWQHDTLVIDKWFSLQAISNLPNTLDIVKKLTQDPLYKSTNPNKVRALLGTFALHNQINFHDASGKAYAFIAEQVSTLDRYNPQTAAKAIEPLTRWQGHDKNRQTLMRHELAKIAKLANVSKDLFEVVTKALGEN